MRGQEDGGSGGGEAVDDIDGGDGRSKGGGHIGDGRIGGGGQSISKSGDGSFLRVFGVFLTVEWYGNWAV